MSTTLGIPQFQGLSTFEKDRAVPYLAIVVGVVAAHFVFVGYLIGGGFLAWRWPATIWAHALVAGWAVVVTAGLVDCPLTAIERWARAGARMSPLPGSGFIAYYFTGVLYPDGWAGAVQIAVFAVVVLSWFGWWRRRGRLSGRSHGR